MNWFNADNYFVTIPTVNDYFVKLLHFKMSFSKTLGFWQFYKELPASYDEFDICLMAEGTYL